LVDIGSGITFIGVVDPRDNTPQFSFEEKEITLAGDGLPGHGLSYIIKEQHYIKNGKIKSVQVKPAGNNGEVNDPDGMEAILRPEFPLVANYLQETYGDHSDNPTANIFVHYGNLVWGSSDNVAFREDFDALVEVPIGKDYSLEKALSNLESSFKEQKQLVQVFLPHNKGMPKQINDATLAVPNDQLSFNLGYDQGLEQGVGLGIGLSVALVALVGLYKKITK